MLLGSRPLPFDMKKNRKLRRVFGGGERGDGAGEGGGRRGELGASFLA